MQSGAHESGDDTGDRRGVHGLKPSEQISEMTREISSEGNTEFLNVFHPVPIGRKWKHIRHGLESKPMERIQLKRIPEPAVRELGDDEGDLEVHGVKKLSQLEHGVHMAGSRQRNHDRMQAAAGIVVVLHRRSVVGGKWEKKKEMCSVL